MYCDVEPLAVIPIVPEVVIGELLTVNADGILTPTLVTVPVPAPVGVTFVHFFAVTSACGPLERPLLSRHYRGWIGFQLAALYRLSATSDCDSKEHR